MKNLYLLLAFVIFTGCSNQPTADKKIKDQTKIYSLPDSAKVPATVADVQTILARTQVPVLCYHHIRPIQMPSRSSMGYEVTADEFKQQMKTLADSGYHSILPEQYYNYLIAGASLPAKPVMITFDDTDEEQFSIAKPEMDKYGFKGVYFIMTISINRLRYMTKEQIKQLADEGHAIECHTWDHHRVDRYVVGDRYIQEGKRQKKVNDWNDQLDKPRKTLEDIIGKKIEYFAYPFGVWNEAAFPELQKRGYKLAFQLSTKRDPSNPLYTVRRIIVSPEWSSTGLVRVMKSSFR